MSTYRQGRSSTALLLATLAATAAAATVAAPAEAAPYTVAACQYPDGATAPADLWIGGVSGSPYTYFGNGCNDGSGLNSAFDAAVGHAYGTQGGWSFTAPANTTLTRLTAVRNSTAGPSQSFGTPVTTIYTDKAQLEACSRFGGCSGLSGAIDYGLGNATYLAEGIQCGGGPGGECPAGEGGSFMSLRRIALTLNDDSAPQFSGQPAGSLTSTTSTAKVRTLSYNATDTGSGIHRHKLILDGSKVVLDAVPDNNSGRCATYSTTGLYSYAIPCKQSLGSTISFDTSTLSDGAHELALQVLDATDQNVANAGPFQLTVDNQPAAASNVKLAGSARVGENLACTGTTSGQNPTLTYQWFRVGAGATETQIVGADKPTYTLLAADAGNRIICALTATDAGGATTSRSAADSGPFAGGAVVKSECDGLKTCGTDPSSPGNGTLGGGNGGSGGPGGNVIVQTGPQISSTSGIAGEPNNGLAASNIASFKNSSLATRQVKWGRRTAVTTRLLNANGQPIANAVVTVAQRTILPRQPGYAPGFSETTLGSVKTDAKGNLRFLVPVGASREVSFAYKANLLNTTFQSRTSIRLHTIAAVTLKSSRKALRNGGMLRLSGIVRSKPIPRTGLVVNLQVFVPGKGWTVFKSLRTSTRGAYSAKYRFTRTHRPTRYRFRAVMRADSAYPYLPGKSGVRTVRVRP